MNSESIFVCRSGFRRGVLFAALICFLLQAFAVCAQDLSDSLSVGRSIPTPDDQSKEPPPRMGLPDSTLPARTRHGSLANLLAEGPVLFGHITGNGGWPDQVALAGVSPSRSGLYIDGIPYHDLFTGRPIYEAAPFELLEPVRWSLHGEDRSGAADTRTRLFDFEQPVTELRFRTGSGSYQEISATHSQTRDVRLPAGLNRAGAVFRYDGLGWTGAYPNSTSRRRQIYGRLRFGGRVGSLAISDHFTNTANGAHGGVLPRAGRGFDSVFQTFGASVALPNARRRLKRNDLRIDLSTRWSEQLPLDAVVWWSTQISRYQDADTLNLLINRMGVSLDQHVNRFLPGHTLTFRWRGTFDTMRRDVGMPVDVDTRRVASVVSATDRFMFAGVSFELVAGMNREGGHTDPFAAASARFSTGPFLTSVGVATSTPASSWLEAEGAPDFVHAVGDIGSGLHSTGFVDVSWAGRLVGASFRVFGSRVQTPLEFIASSRPDSVAWLRSETSSSSHGLALSVGYRDRLKRGFYVAASGTRRASSETDALSELLSRVCPEFSLDGRTGLRYVVFDGDLDFDLFVRARYWSAFSGRTIHPPTGLLVLRQAGSQQFGQSGTLDVYFSGGIRTATVFVSLENILSGFTQPGTLLVPVYPLMERQFRFGVFWRITG